MPGTAGPPGADGPPGAPGPPGPQGEQGIPGASVSFFDYSFNAQTVEPPASGQIRLNNASQNLATRMWVSDITAPGNDGTNVLALVQQQHKLYLQDKDNADHYVVYKIAGMVAAKAGAYKEFPIVYDSGPADVPTGQRAFLGILSPPGLAADSAGAATEVAVWQDSDTLKSSTRLLQDANGRLTIASNDLIGYGKYGLKLQNEQSGGHTVLQSLPAGGLYITDQNGTPQSLALGTWANPNDGTLFSNASGHWTISAGRLHVGGTGGLVDTNAQLSVMPEAVDRTGTVIQLKAGQTADALLISNSAGVALMRVDNAGKLFFSTDVN